MQKAREKETEERLFNQWVVQLPHMEENYISFEDYKERAYGRNIDKRSNDEILEEVAQIELELGVR